MYNHHIMKFIQDRFPCNSKAYITVFFTNNLFYQTVFLHFCSYLGVIPVLQQTTEKQIGSPALADSRRTPSNSATVSRYRKPPVPVTFRTCICSKIETCPSRTYHIFGLWISNIHLLITEVKKTGYQYPKYRWENM